MAKLEKTTETVVKNTYTLTMTEFEAQCLVALLGQMSGKGKAVKALGYVWDALYESGVTDAPLEIQSNRSTPLYITDEE